MSPIDLNDAFRLICLAKRCGSQTLDNLERLDDVFRRSGGAKFDSKVLDIVRSVVKTSGDSSSQFGTALSKPFQNPDQYGLKSERFGSKGL